MELDINDDNVTSEAMCWRIGLKCLFNDGYISSEEFESMYSPDNVFTRELSDRESLIAHMVIECISDTDMLNKLITDEFNLDRIGNDRNITDTEWRMYMKECLGDGIITEQEHLDLVDLFTTETGDIKSHERLAAKYILEKLQLRNLKDEPNVIRYIDSPSNEQQLVAVSEDPSTISEIENPTFDALMMANGMV